MYHMLTMFMYGSEFYMYVSYDSTETQVIVFLFSEQWLEALKNSSNTVI